MRSLAACLTVLMATAATPSFEVASIKPNRTNSPVSFKFEILGRRLTGRNVTAKLLTRIAWRLQDFQITGGPAWFSSDGFDVDAAAERPVASSQMPLLLQSLLADRFKLTSHRTTRESVVYALVTGKGAPKIKLSADQSPFVGDHPEGARDGPALTAANMRVTSPGNLIGEAVPMSLFVSLLSQQVGRPVVNKTGLTARYDIDLRWTPDAADASSGPSVFTAIQEQLGLRLESARGPVEVLIIDHIEKPSTN